jgi:hypothetical protein
MLTNKNQPLIQSLERKKKRHRNETYIKREEARLIIHIHRVVHPMHVRIEIAREPALDGVALRGEGSRVAELGIGHIVRAGVAAEGRLVELV